MSVVLADVQALAASGWRDAYGELVERLPGLAGRARLTMCGMSTCVDAYLRLEEAAALLAADPATPQGAFGARLLDRARRGVGGEISVDWPDGPGWVEANLPLSWGLGGTGAQAAQMLAHLGAPTLVAVADRTSRQLDRFHPGVGLATAEGLQSVGAITGLPGIGKLPHYIVEFSAGATVGPYTLPRSSRVICRFGDDPLEDDPLFDRLSIAMAASAGSAILSGYNEVPSELMEASLQRTAALARAWRDAGLPLVHLELGDFHDMAEAWPVLDGLAGPVNSLGLSLSELNRLVPDSSPAADRAAALGDRLKLDRVAVHYDTFALAVTTGDPARELEALMTGSLVAATRARHGHVIVPDRVPDGAVFEPPSFPRIGRIGSWNLVTCATPWLKHPAATIGLGDTFLAGTLLALGRA
ncbi:MAG TPA: ADP-dependent glucokinase/phosphofructokinase [Geminicoccus sp.]|jgi:ADP-dependent phosphofructokinase/glucokinase|uniref:ADP-dependent glucokinase/phosphofructokinase n=1 Tax=Geminicoccus sp. TaxID=2024832 RepID=UPI002E358240|nr:ADP-dependent glucokinase/phosphofructokinase [Geminicoccus sp.]HEX2528706.1 ADP-dependent glucokinase/phosphofructokinase [Geminicoccus sp.]